ncbi:MAG: zinc ribbon domain-containing protein [Candidatus Bathyarchaeota archaeon]|nr:zinc ribbon domain-containing protein [Candidatus Bathyarchaeota archaeon]
MSSSRSWFWGNIRQSAFAGWFLALLCGSGVGAGVSLLFFSRALLSRIPSVDPNVYADVQLLSAFLIFIGLASGILGILATYNSTKMATGKPAAAPFAGKRYCRFCGAENKNDAYFCEKCGKMIVEE